MEQPNIPQPYAAPNPPALLPSSTLAITSLVAGVLGFTDGLRLAFLFGGSVIDGATGFIVGFRWRPDGLICRDTPGPQTENGQPGHHASTELMVPHGSSDA